MPGFIREKVGASDFAVIFTVEGTGQFPIDMLRYDGCYPLTEAEDAPAIAAHTYGATRRVVLVARPLKGEKFVNLTPDRWRSFSWKFVGIGELRDGKRWPSPGVDASYYHRAE